MRTPPYRVDYLIAGAGLAGCALALRTLARGYSTMLCAAPRVLPDVHLGETTRPHELTDCAAHSLPSETFVHWAGTEIGRVSSSQAAQVDKHSLNRGLLEEAIRMRAIYLPETRLLAFERTARSWRIDSTSGTIHSAFVVDATGRAAAVARKLGARRVAFDRLTAETVSFPASRRPAQHLIEAAENGWWFCAHHPALGSVATYFTDNDMRLNFDDALRQSRFAKIFLGAGRTNRPRRLAAGTAILNPVAGPFWFAIGDAALSCDPLSSSGISNAFHLASWALDGTVVYSKRVAREFSSYLQTYKSVYASAQRNGEFWRRRSSRYLCG
jgi:flavin-dependent dehydrogenase